MLPTGPQPPPFQWTSQSDPCEAAGLTTAHTSPGPEPHTPAKLPDALLFQVVHVVPSQCTAAALSPTAQKSFDALPHTPCMVSVVIPTGTSFQYWPSQCDIQDAEPTAQMS